MPDAMTTKMEHLTDDERRIHALYAYLGKQHLQGFTGQDVDYLLTTIAALRERVAGLEKALNDYLDWGPMTNSDRYLLEGRFRAALAAQPPTGGT
jgi:hypothetical protein